jgi:predicted protein tyrosine phosphatase
LAAARKTPIECSSAGIDPLAKRPLTREVADRADRIFVMEQYMEETLVREFGQSHDKIICLDIPDIFDRHDPALTETLLEKLAEHI